MIARLSIFSSLILLIACNPAHVDSAEELVSYIQDPENGLVQEAVRGEMSFQLTYQPKDVFIQKTLHGMGGGFTPEDVDSLRRSLEEYDYFVFRLSNLHQEVLNSYVNTPRFEEVINYISFGIGEDIRLIQGQDTIPVFDFIHTRTYGMAEHTSLLLVFKSKLQAAEEDCIVQFDGHFFKTGMQTFPFQYSAITRIPTLDFKSYQE